MARIRSNHPGQWSDEDFVCLSFPARLLALALRNIADDHGIFEWKPRTIKMQLFPADNIDIEPLLSELVTHKQAIQFEVEERQYGALRNFMRWQRPKKPSYSYPITEMVGEYVGNKHAAGGTGKRLATESSEPVPNQFPTSTENSPQRKEEGGKRKVRDKSLDQSTRENRVSEIDREFSEQFWPAYPRKVSKGQAEKAYRTARKDTSLEIILAAVLRYAKERAGKDAQFTKHPSVWLNAKSWFDEPVGNRDKKSNGEPSHAFLFGRG